MAIDIANFGKLMESDDRSDLFYPATVGGWYANPLMTGSAANPSGLNALLGHLLYSGLPGITIDQLDTYVTNVYAGGGIVRAGIYTPNIQSNPFQWSAGIAWATLVQEVGTVVTTSTGRLTMTIGGGLVIPARTWFVVAGVEQGDASGKRSLASPNARFSPFGASNIVSAYNSQGAFALVQSGVSGALPASFVPTGTSNIDDGIGIHRSA